jgi:hypothetical protein
MSNTIKVYWAPVHHGINNPPRDFNMFYYDIESLLVYLNKNKALTEDKKNTFLRCPSFISLNKNTFILENPLDSHIKIEGSKIVPVIQSNIGFNFDHEPSIFKNPLIVYDMKWVFFTEEDELEMELTSPYFSNAPHMQYGSIVPGGFDIGKWFRHIALEYNLWNDGTEMKIDKGEPLAYVSFKTDKKVELVRFKMNLDLKTYAQSAANSSKWEPMVPLVERYERFKRTRMKNLVMKEIKENILDNNNSK